MYDGNCTIHLNEASCKHKLSRRCKSGLPSRERNTLASNRLLWGRWREDWELLAEPLLQQLGAFGGDIVFDRATPDWRQFRWVELQSEDIVLFFGDAVPDQRADRT